MKRWLASLAVLGGCDAVFDIDRLPALPPCAIDDEDCDQQRNVDDGCPADVDEPTQDQDGDGVGDACDPDRAVPGDRIVVFDGFLDNARGWRIRGGTWQLDNGAFTAAPPADGRVELDVPAVNQPSVAAVFDELSTVDNGRAGIFGADGSSELWCVVVRFPDETEVLHMEGFFINGDIGLTGTGPIRIQAGQYRDGRLYCRARHGSDPDVEVTSFMLSPVQLDRFGMLTSSGAASYKSITLFDVQ